MIRCTETGVVECYSGTRYGERPLALRWEGVRHRVERIERAWRDPEGPAFLVLTEGGMRFHLRHLSASGSWDVAPAGPARD